MINKLQKYLITHSLQELKKEFGINYRIHDYKVSLNYNQIEASDWCPFAKVCRGLILAKEDQTPIKENEPLDRSIVLACPFDRFFNYGQEAADEIDWDNAKIWDKLDGSLGILYFDRTQHKNNWCLATRSVPEADVPMNGFNDLTFKKLFYKCFERTTNTKFEDQKHKLSKWHTYLFEITSPLNKIVVPYENYGLTLLGIRHCLIGTEHDIEHSQLAQVVHRLGISIPKKFDLNSVGDLTDFVCSFDPLNPDEGEGVVACDSKFNRVKIKNPQYVAINRIWDLTANSARAIMQIILSGQLDDVMPLMAEEIQEKAAEMAENFSKYAKGFEGIFHHCMEKADTEAHRGSSEHQKAFAIEGKKTPEYMHPLMQIYHGKAKDFNDFLEKQKTDKGEYNKSFLDNMVKICQINEQ